MYHSIVVPLDGSPFGERALPLAASIARAASAALHLVHVHVAIEAASIDVIPSRGDDMQRELAYLERVKRRLARDEGISVTTALLNDSVAEALRAYVSEQRIDLVVMTTHGRGALSRLWLGSVADRLVRQSPAPVLLVRPTDVAPELEAAPEIKRVLIPLDGSALAEQILPRAVALGALTDAEYTLLQVAELALSGEGAELYGSAFDPDVQERVRAQSQHYLERVAAPLRAESLAVSTATVFGWSAQDILEYAREHGFDAIALATHGRGGVTRLLLGSVADKVVRGATVPVLLFHPTEIPAGED